MSEALLWGIAAASATLHAVQFAAHWVAKWENEDLAHQLRDLKDALDGLLDRADPPTNDVDPREN